MGLYRLFLAMLVAISHAGISFYGYNPGVVAVISFFILSGYVMSVLIEKYYKQPSSIPVFYLDRAARLFPQYVFYMILASLLIYLFKIDSPYIANLTFPKLLTNFLIIPQGYYMYLKNWVGGAMVIPQAWSLSLEMTFYLFIPWIILYLSKRQIYSLACVSFGVFLVAYLGKINSDIYGYRLLVGTLFMFLVGWSFFQNDRDSKKFRFITFLLAGFLLIISFFVKSLYTLAYNKEVLVGLMTGILAISFIKHFRFSSLDEFWGNLSYGVFLNHFIIIWLMEKFLMVKTFDILNITILLISSCTLAYGSYLYIERPALKWRHAIRSGIIHKKTISEVNPATTQ